MYNEKILTYGSESTRGRDSGTLSLRNLHYKLGFHAELGVGGHFDSFSREKSLCQFELHFGRYLIYVTNLGLLLHACV